MPKQKSWIIFFVTIVAMLFFSILTLNLKPHQVKNDQKIEIPYGISDIQFNRTLGHLLGPPIIGGNKITAYYNGEQIFPAMLDAIRSAKVSITFESYIYWSGAIGKKFADALAEKARAGVKVHVLVDWVGSAKIEKSYFDELRSAGADIEYYHPLHWYNLFRMNNRTHRKILVIDGLTGFTGGVGISDDWNGAGDRPEIWRDSHYQVTGPAAAYLQSGFMDNWLKTRPEVLHGDSYFPELTPVGDTQAQVFISSPREGGSSMRLMYLAALAAAKKTLLIESAYFVPDELTVAELIKAKKRGVKVQIIVPGPYVDSDIVLAASKSLWGDLLENEIEIYEFQPAKFHCKVLIADNYFVSVGSTNFDDRSFRLNDEANLNVLDSKVAEHETAVFVNDLSHSKKVTLSQWQNRPWSEKIKEVFVFGLLNQL